MPVKNLPDSVVTAVFDLVIQRKLVTNKKEMKWLKKMLDIAVRHVEYFVECKVSIEAQKIADANGLIDLQNTGFKAPSTWKAGKDLYFEHAKPVADVIKELLSDDSLTLEKTREVLQTMEIAWITREEEKRLPKINRGNWQEVYTNCGITLL
jgi:hypothetical protein